MSDRPAAAGRQTFSLRQVLMGTPIPPFRIVAASAGFLARGGVLILAVPIWVLPTPVGVTLLVPSDAFGASGLSPGFVQVLAAVIACLATVACLAAVAAAVVEMDTFDWLMGGPGARSSSDARQPASGPAAPSRTGLAGRLVVVEAIATLPAAAAAWLAVGRLIEVGRQEYLLPSSLDTAFAVRVLNGARAQVVLLVLCVLVADLVHAVLARIVLDRAAAAHADRSDDAPLQVERAGSPDVGGPRRSVRPATSARDLVRRGTAVVTAWLVGWIVSIACVGPGIAVLLLGWSSVRDAYLGPGPEPGAAGAVLLLVPTVLLASAWFLAAILAGIASLVRSALWTAAMRV